MLVGIEARLCSAECRQCAEHGGAGRDSVKGAMRKEVKGGDGNATRYRTATRLHRRAATDHPAAMEATDTTVAHALRHRAQKARREGGAPLHPGRRHTQEFGLQAA